MRGLTVVCLRWRLTGRIEIFSNLGKLYDCYDKDRLGVSRYTLDRRNLYELYQNDAVEIIKLYVK